MSRRVCQTGLFAVLDDTEGVLLSKQTERPSLRLDELTIYLSAMNASNNLIAVTSFARTCPLGASEGIAHST